MCSGEAALREVLEGGYGSLPRASILKACEHAPPHGRGSSGQQRPDHALMWTKANLIRAQTPDPGPKIVACILRVVLAGAASCFVLVRGVKPGD